MGRYCCACNTYIYDAETAYTIVDSLPRYALCDTCHVALRDLPRSRTDNEYETRKSRFMGLIRSPETPDQIKNVIRDADDEYWYRKERGTYDEAYATAMYNLMLTTGSSFDGYCVVKYLDIISSEVFYKNSLMNSLSANMNDFIDSIGFRERELSGAAMLVDRAKQYTMKAFRKKAVDMGANAVLGIRFDTKFDNDSVYISVHGTAVFVEKLPEQQP